VSLDSIGVQWMPLRQAHQGAADDEQSGVFELIAATIAVQAVQAAQTGSAGGPFAGLAESRLEAPANEHVLPAHVMPEMVAQVAQAKAGVLEPAAAQEINLPQSRETANETAAMPSNRPKIDPSAYTVHHSTLPVMVAGQLVELTLLRERKPSREAGPTRRLSMVLEAPGSGSITVDAHLEGDRLVISLESAIDPDSAARGNYAEEVAALARRLGWNFTETHWEISR
jgi:hypothetical protein